MDTASLESAYQRILDLAAHGSFTTPPDDWGPDMVLAHLTVNDELLIGAVRQVLAGEEEASYDNAAGTDDAALAQLGPWPALIDRLQTSSRQLVDLASQLTDGLEDRAIPVHIVDGGEVAVDQPLPIGRLLSIHAEVHLPSHLSQLEGLRA
ncbi:MAG TPA: hypothetical protein VGO92_07810 [Acidimicrobiales bacterium]|jgi:hypothetical protein|nr:hypothetical protein [Acidimicrobiales bacterium]